jgi:hypothetical protein
MQFSAHTASMLLHRARIPSQDPRVRLRDRPHKGRRDARSAELPDERGLGAALEARPAFHALRLAIAKVQVQVVIIDGGSPTPNMWAIPRTAVASTVWMTLGGIASVRKRFRKAP